MAAAGRRLLPGQRSRQLLEVAARHFAAHPYQDVSMSDIAAEAGVSRALVYRYYPSKRDLFAAVYQDAANGLVNASGLESALPLMDQILAGLDAHFDFFEANARTVLVANRGELAGDPLIEAIIANQLAQLRHSMLDAMGVTGAERSRTSTALHGWLAFVRVVCVEWLAEDVLTRIEVRDLCLRTLLAAVGLDITSTPLRTSLARRPR